MSNVCDRQVFHELDLLCFYGHRSGRSCTTIIVRAVNPLFWHRYGAEGRNGSGSGRKRLPEDFPSPSFTRRSVSEGRWSCFAPYFQSLSAEAQDQSRESPRSAEQASERTALARAHTIQLFLLWEACTTSVCLSLFVRVPESSALRHVDRRCTWTLVSTALRSTFPPCRVHHRSC